MADGSDWPRRRDWYLRWGEAFNAERLGIIWREHRGLTIAILLALAVVGALWFWGSLAAFISVGVAIFGSLIAYWRLHTDRMRAETDRLRQVTDSFAQAVEQLTHEDASVRLGAIHALERIARQNRDEHWRIMETLTAYVREQSAPMMTERLDPKMRAQPPRPAPADIQAAFTVLGRRRLDHEQDTGAKRPHLNLTGAYLVQAHPEALPRPDFGRAKLDQTKLYLAQLDQANLQGCSLYEADIRKASLREVDLQGTFLVGADLERADLQGANLEGANLQGANVCWANLSTARGLTQDQLNSAMGDRHTTIPEGLTRPEHWSQ